MEEHSIIMMAVHEIEGCLIIQGSGLSLHFSATLHCLDIFKVCNKHMGFPSSSPLSEKARYLICYHYIRELFFTWVITLHSIFDLTSHFICDKSMSQLQNKLAQLAPEIYGVPSHLLCPFSYIPTVKCRHPKTKCSVINMNTRESKTE